MPAFPNHRLIISALACLGLGACSTFDNASGRIAGLVSPYKAEVVQGNFVSKEQKEALQIGMPRVQVRDILGTPLVASVFHADRWDYAFTMRRQGAQPQERKLTVFFKGDQLVKVESDELISEKEFVDSLSGDRKPAKAPVLQLPPDQLPAPTPAPASTNASAPSNPSGSAPARVYPPLEAVAR